MEVEYLKESDFITPSEAAYRWNMKRNTIIAALNRGRFDNYLVNGDVKKFTLHGTTEWDISVKAMREVYGEEDKVQVVELWAKVGDDKQPDKVIFFVCRPVLRVKSFEKVPVDTLEKLRLCQSYQEACDVADAFRNGDHIDHL